MLGIGCWAGLLVGWAGRGEFGGGGVTGAGGWHGTLFFEFGTFWAALGLGWAGLVAAKFYG